MAMAIQQLEVLCVWFLAHLGVFAYKIDKYATYTTRMAALTDASG